MEGSSSQQRGDKYGGRGGGMAGGGKLLQRLLFWALLRLAPNVFGTGTGRRGVLPDQMGVGGGGTF